MTTNYDDPYTRCKEYVGMKKDFLFGLLEKYLVAFFMNPENKGHDPFVYIRIFQYDESKMKDKVDAKINKQKALMPIVSHTIKKKVKTYKKTTHCRATNQWLGDEKTVIQPIHEIETVEVKEVKYDDEVKCFIQLDTKLEQEGVLVINKRQRLFEIQNNIIFKKTRSIFDDVVDETFLEKGVVSFDPSTDMNRIINVLDQESKPIKVIYSDKPELRCIHGSVENLSLESESKNNNLKYSDASTQTDELKNEPELDESTGRVDHTMMTIEDDIDVFDFDDYD